jgi:hypothetical protein
MKTPTQIIINNVDATSVAGKDDVITGGATDVTVASGGGGVGGVGDGDTAIAGATDDVTVAASVTPVLTESFDSLQQMIDVYDGARNWPHFVVVRIVPLYDVISCCFCSLSYVLYRCIMSFRVAFERVQHTILTYCLF